MNAIIEAAVNHARTVVMILLLVLVTGGFAYVVIAKESKPDINVPIIYVSMKHDGISPEDAERLLVRPMEQELRSIAGIKEIRSTASQGFATVLMEFDAGFDPDKALSDVRAKIDLEFDCTRVRSGGTIETVVEQQHATGFDLSRGMLSRFHGAATQRKC